MAFFDQCADLELRLGGLIGYSIVCMYEVIMCHVFRAKSKKRKQKRQQFGISKKKKKKCVHIHTFTVFWMDACMYVCSHVVFAVFV